MPQQPLASQLHVDRPLTDVSIGYLNPAYIADKVFPIVPVLKQSDKIPKYDQSPFFRDEAKLRQPGSKSTGIGFTVTTSSTYFCDRYSTRFEIADEQRDNADQPFNMDRDGAILVTDKLQMKRETKFAADFFTTSVWGAADKVGGTDFTKWSDYGASTPLVDVASYKDGVEGLIGREPNKFILGKQVLVQLMWHPDLVDTIKYTQRGVLTADLIAALFGFDELLVGRTIYTTTAEGTAEASVSYTRIWGKHALMLSVPNGPSLMTPAAGYTFVWQRVPNAIQYIKRMRDEEREVDIIEGNTYFAQTKTSANSGQFLQNAVA